MDKTTSVKHYFDQWHVAKGLVKKLLVASKLKGCEVISDWIKAEKKITSFGAKPQQKLAFQK